jgi:predicted kinase
VRVLEGRIVEGHGDLRPEHVCLTKPVQIFDCVEFSHELRSLDIADELSFLDVECELLGSNDIGGRIFAAYSLASGDIPVAPLVAFYKSYRAAVRAKVAALRADQLATDMQPEAYQQAQAHLALADRYAGQLGPMIFVLVRGLSGSGKTTLASEVARRLGAELLSSDAVRHELYGPSSPDAAFGSGIYQAENRQRVYKEMLTRTEQYLSEGISVILDGTYLALADRQQAVSAGQRWCAPSLVVTCQCDPNEARQRIADRQARGGSLSAARPEFYDRQRELEEASPPELPTLNVETSLPLTVQVEQVIDALRGQYVR